MKIKNWRLYTANGEFIVHLKILLKSLLMLVGGIMIGLLIMSLIIVYGHNIIHFILRVL